MAYRAVFSALKQRNGNVWGIVWPSNVARRIFLSFLLFLGFLLFSSINVYSKAILELVDFHIHAIDLVNTTI